MDLIFIAVGAIVATITSAIYWNRKKAIGTFELIPGESDDDAVSIRIHVSAKDVLTADEIVLKRE